MDSSVFNISKAFFVFLAQINHLSSFPVHHFFVPLRPQSEGCTEQSKLIS